uniref:Uncharacterized protein n=1 Tax=Arundo donax TaxID=35708 RepID=A0A0A9DLI4_ARUDO
MRACRAGLHVVPFKVPQEAFMSDSSKRMVQFEGQKKLDINLIVVWCLLQFLDAKKNESAGRVP